MFRHYVFTCVFIAVFSWAAAQGQNSSVVRCLRLKQSEGVEIRCFDAPNNDPIPCEQAYPGTVAQVQCQRRRYTSTYRVPIAHMTCKENGVWKPFRSFGCKVECGKIVEPIYEPYFLRGREDPATSLPWHAAILKYSVSSKNYSKICGGSLVEKSVVITAAHCVTDNDGAIIGSKENFKVILGSYSTDYSEHVKDPKNQIFRIKNIWVPETYDQKTFQSDIAVIQLDGEAQYGEYVGPVCYLPAQNNSAPSPGKVGKVSGSAFAKPEHSLSGNYQFAEFSVVSTDDCKESLLKTPPPDTFCAGDKDGVTGTICDGDSGGGMILPDDSGSSRIHVLEGVLSHGKPKPEAGQLCDSKNHAVFTHVGAFRDFVQSKLNLIKGAST